MNERDVRLLFEAGHWEAASVIRDADNDGWKTILISKNKKNPTQILCVKSGSPRIFKTSDTAIQWCKEIGFSNITIHFDSTINEQTQMATNMKTVLLVEDNKDDVELTIRAFEKSKLKNNIVVAKDGMEAMDYLFANNQYKERNPADVPNLILLDINLPKMSGLEVLEKIRANETTKCIPVVLLTTSDEKNDVIKGYQLGSNSYIKKPVSFQVFADVVNNLCEYWLNINTPPPQ